MALRSEIPMRALGLMALAGALTLAGCGKKAEAPAPVEASSAGSPIAHATATTATATAAPTPEATPPAATEAELVEQGKALFARYNCDRCHGEGQHTRIGADLRGLYGSTVELADGTTLKADDAYIRESILDPQAKIVKGFSPAMTKFAGIIGPAEMDALVAYIKTLK